MRGVSAVASLFLSGLLMSGLVAAERGWFGMSVNVLGERFSFNPPIKRITIEKVLPDSPAARGRLAIGDEVVQVERHRVAGSKARDLQPLMEKSVGQPLHLKLKRGSGKVYDAVLIAATPPKS